MTTEKKPAVYMTGDICKLFNCGINQVPVLIARGVIPKPLPSKAAPGINPKKRWAKGVVDKRLGIDPDMEDRVRQIVAEMLQTYSERQSA